MKRLQATTKPRAKAYQVKPGQNHGSPRLASGYRYLEVLPKYSAIPSGERKPVLPFVAQPSVMGNEDKSVMGKRKAKRERMSGILQLNHNEAKEGAVTKVDFAMAPPRIAPSDYRDGNELTTKAGSRRHDAGHYP
ncbi:hypothetical protein G5I_06011 [Acromyrmex echinatior]|uniref:Uncharacterized protein n=1 Tax=Acromyrmex echinatior TaxID=103372 RepID=F4WJX7_ACREC|nr:hypothetical protein G5I_06011 [Acromyrmex echinatior]